MVTSTVMQMRSPRVQIPTTLMIFLSICIRCDGNANDESGNRNSGSPKNTTKAFNRNGEAGFLDGVDSST